MADARLGLYHACGLLKKHAMQDQIVTDGWFRWFQSIKILFIGLNEEANAKLQSPTAARRTRDRVGREESYNTEISNGHGNYYRGIEDGQLYELNCSICLLP